MSHSKNLEDWIFKCMGGVAILVCMLSSIPQTIKMYKTKKTNDVSKTGIIVLLLGTIMLEVYSFYFNLWEMFFPNLFTITGLLIQLIFKKCYDGRVGLLDDTSLFNRSDTSEIIDITKSRIQVHHSPSSGSPMDLDEDLESR